MIPFELGPFTLFEPFARGGMGEIWHGEHTRQKVPVAVKVLTAEAARRPTFRDAFLREVEAVARLDHPGIVLVFDVGEVDGPAASASDDRLLAGSPFLAMELAKGGALTRGAEFDDWFELKRLLLRLLQALGYAHARGVIHRDLKPGNVLLFGQPEPLECPKLSDFGIARALRGTDDQRDALVLSGTPSYMAPEQIAGRLRDQGPWTDLYALGCIAFELAAGHLPFRGRSRDVVWRAHLLDSIPRLEARVEVPRGFESWIARLLAKRPWGRFRRAAEAAYALESLDDTDLIPRRPVSTDVDNMPETTGDPNRGAQNTSNRSEPEPSKPAPAAPATEDVITIAVRASARTGTGSVATHPYSNHTTDESWPQRMGASVYDSDQMPETERAPVTRPRLPAEWRVEKQDAPISLVGAGLGLFGLRPVPIVARENERDLLWKTLHAVEADGVARAVCLRGAPGTGKSRLAEWLSERAHECGVAAVMHARHSHTAGPGEAISRMLADYFRCEHLDHDSVVVRLRNSFRAHGWNVGLGNQLESEIEALAELIEPDLEEDVGTRFATSQERHHLLLRMLERIGSTRLIIMWLDDVQWGSDALGLTLHLLEASRTRVLPLLMIITIRDDVLESRPIERRLIGDIVGHEGVTTQHIGPLPSGSQDELVRGILRLDPHLAEQVATATEGNPLFAVQLIGDWVERDALETGEQGFRLRTDAESELPRNINEIWERRINRLVPPDSEDRVALEAAAALGMNIEGNEWSRLCDRLEIPLPEGVLLRLASQHLIERTEGAWRFAHGMVREALERSATDAGRWQAIHRTCAEVIEETSTSGFTAERRARHRLAAGEPEHATGPLAEAFAHQMSLANPDAAEALLASYFECLDAFESSEHDHRVARGAYMRGCLALFRGEYEEGSTQIQLALDAAVANGWNQLRFDATLKRARIYGIKGQSTEGRTLLEATLRWAEDEGETHRVAETCVTLAEILRGLGERAEARAVVRRAITIYERNEHRRGLAIALFLLSTVLDKQTDAEEVTELLNWSIELSIALRHRDRVALAYNGLGEVARLAGRLEEAEENYRLSLEIYEAIGAASRWIVRSNLGMVLLSAHRFDQARGTFEQCRHAFEEMGWKALVATTTTAQLACCAGQQDWESWDRLMVDVEQLLASTQVVDLDLGVSTLLAAELAVAADQGQRARPVLVLARTQWETLDREDQVRRVDELSEKTKKIEIAEVDQNKN